MLHPKQLEWYDADNITLADGRQSGGLHRAITRDGAETLNRWVQDANPVHMINIGLGWGMSALAMLSGSAGLVDSLDPFQHEQFHNIGVDGPNELGFFERHRWIGWESQQYLANKRPVEFAFVDGCHNFDACFVDCFWITKWLPVGGHIAIDDLQLFSVQHVVHWLETNVGFRVLDKQGRMMLLRKETEPKRAWDHFVEFAK